MKDIPIIMSQPMVLALLREVERPGTGKTMTRRHAWNERDAVDEDGEPAILRVKTIWQDVKPGDRLWVKESIKFTADHMSFYYEADKKALSDYTIQCLRNREFERGEPYKNLGARYIPKFASRLTLIVTATKIERLQEISYEDAIAEGCIDFAKFLAATEDEPSRFLETTEATARRLRWPQRQFAELWTKLHGTGAWEVSPEVVTLTFTVHKQNIGAMPKEEAA